MGRGVTSAGAGTAWGPHGHGTISGGNHGASSARSSSADTSPGGSAWLYTSSDIDGRACPARSASSFAGKVAADRRQLREARRLTLPFRHRFLSFVSGAEDVLGRRGARRERPRGDEGSVTVRASEQPQFGRASLLRSSGNTRLTGSRESTLAHASLHSLNERPPGRCKLRRSRSPEALRPSRRAHGHGNSAVA
jgi:hypothetical protein